jgi:hypothetical protein
MGGQIICWIAGICFYQSHHNCRNDDILYNMRTFHLWSYFKLRFFPATLGDESARGRENALRYVSSFPYYSHPAEFKKTYADCDCDNDMSKDTRYSSAYLEVLNAHLDECGVERGMCGEFL